MIEILSWLFDLSWLIGNSDFSWAVDVYVLRNVTSVTSATSGLRYGEIVFDDITTPGATHGIQCGITGASSTKVMVSTTGRIWLDSTSLTSYDFNDGPTFTAGQVAMFAVNCSNGKCWLGKVGTGWYAGGDPAAGTGQVHTLAIGPSYLHANLFRLDFEPLGGAQFSLRTQNSQFTGTKPVGFSAWYP